MAASTRTAGLIFAIVILVVFAGVVTFFVVRSPSGAVRGVQAGPAPVPDPTMVPAKGEAGAPTRFGAGEGFYLQMVDKDDPSVVRGELSAARSRPIEGQTFRVALEKPVIWYFLKDGRTIYARADKGTAYIPDQAKGRPSMPQDGVLEGSVVVKVFEAREGTIRPDPETDDALLVGRTSMVKFDGELGQAEAPEKVTIAADGIDFSGLGVTVLFDKVRQRLDMLHIARAEFLKFDPAALERENNRDKKPKPTGELASKPVKGGTGTGGARPAAVKAAAVEVLYRLVCTDTVKLTQGDRVIEAEMLEGWARLVDNRLRPGAVMMRNAGPLVKRGTGTGNGDGAKPSGGATAKVDGAAAQPVGGDPLVAASDQPITLTWKGPLELKPLAAKAPELDYNDVVARFTSKADTGVTFRDAKAKATAQGNLLEYGATRREVALGGKGKDGARLTSEGRGYATAERFDMSLVTGTARVAGAGVLTGLDKAGQEAQRFLWDKDAEFQFKKDAKGEVTQVLTKVTASGNARATDLESSIGGDTLIATLVPVDGQQSRLHTLALVGKAHAEDGKGGSLDADKMDIRFVANAEKPDQSDPSEVIAQGAVKGQQKDSVLEASWLRAVIARLNDEQGAGSLTATRLEAKEIVFAGADGVHAKAPLLTADPVARIAQLTGPAGSVVGPGASTISGQDMTFHDVERRLLVAGPGTLAHEAAGGAGEPVSRIVATWTREMAFDDLQGTATCVGESGAELTKTLAGALVERDTMKAEQVDLWLTAGSAGAAANEQDPAQARKLLRANMQGTLATREGGTPASIESRRYAAGAGQPAGNAPVLERLMYLEGARINADDVQGTLDVPVPGRLLFVDRREAAKQEGKGANPLEGVADARGTALFTWAGSMNLNRSKGLVTLRESVRLTHQRPEDTQKSELECETLVAEVRETAGGKPAGPDSFSGELVSADASGAVWMRYGGRELIADSAKYDAINRVIRATAAADNYVQIHNPDGRTSEAKSLTWDLIKDTIELRQPRPVTTPTPRR
jgi:hypothetical protein